MANRKPAIPEIIQRRRSRVLIARGYRSLLLRVLVLALALYLLLTQVFLLTQVSGNGMFPAVKDGDLVLAYRLQSEYAKNDVVVYRAAGKNRVGRIVGREGDVILLDDSGDLLVNGTSQAGEILYPTYAGDGCTYPYVVPERPYFILSDYRTQCEDSRDFGAVPAPQITGKVITILRRRGI